MAVFEVAAIILAPCLLAFLNAVLSRRAKRQDYERQDAIEARQVARDQAVANTAALAQQSLTVIHALVNSDMTEAKQAQLDACRHVLDLLSAQDGPDPNEVAKTRARIAALEAELVQRHTAAGTVDIVGA